MKRIASIFAHVWTARRAARPALALSLLLSLLAGIARADVKSLVDSGKISWTGSPEQIKFLNGTVVTSGDYDELALKYTDTSAAGTLTIAEGVKGAARVLLVGGGGAGGTSTSTTAGAGGGGGAGGFIDQTQTIGAGTYSITVGAGGPAATATDTAAAGNDGADSSFVGGSVSLVAKGGGGGGAQSVGRPGGSGGGGSFAAASCNGGTGTTDQGNDGGKGSAKQYGAGGGGAGAVGSNAGTAAKGGAGKISNITGEDLYYAGGGAGGRTKGTSGIAGGVGGGGSGGSTAADAEDGFDGLGGGGGGGASVSVGGAGGSGVVIVRITQLVETQVAVPVVEAKTFNKENQIALDFGIAYTYVSGVTNATDVGSYSFVVKPGQDLEWDSASGGGTGEKTVNWSIVKRQIEKPTTVTGAVYDGTAKVGVTYVDELPDYCTFDASSVTNATNAGTYSFSVSLNDAVNTSWADGTTTPVADSWTIAKVEVAPPQPNTGLVYNGTAQNAFASLDWSLYDLVVGTTTNETAGGSYKARFHLKGNSEAENYVWSDSGSSADSIISWSIATADNAITSLLLSGWRIGETPNTPSIVATWGADTVEYSYGFGESAESVSTWVTSTDEITKEGTWVLRAVIPATANWAQAEKTTAFVMWNDPNALFHSHAEITVKGTTTALSNFQIPVRISETSLPGFSYEGASPTALAFVDAEGKLLSHDVDSWDATGESVVWVKLNELPTAGTTITMYWNLQEGHVAPDNNSASVWSDYAGVWHLGGGSGNTAGTKATIDSTGNAAAATVGSKSSGVEGVVGGALDSTSNSGGPILKIPASEAVNSLSNAAFTASFWARIDYNSGGKTGWPALFARRSAHGGYGYGVRVVADTINQTSGTDIRVYAGASNIYGTWKNDKRIAAGKWQRHDVMFKAGRIEWYIDGAFQGASDSNYTTWTDYGYISLGGWGDGSDSLIGAVDELRMRTGEINNAYKALIAAERKYHTDPSMLTPGTVYNDGLKVDYWVVAPAIDKNSWDINDTAGTFTSTGTLRYGTVTNYIYSIDDPGQVYASISEITGAGAYRAVFARVDTPDFQPLQTTIDFRILESKPYAKIAGTNGDSGRVLLMNRDRNTICQIDYQGYSDTDSRRSTFWQISNSDETGLPFNLQSGTNSTLWTESFGNRLWYLDNCRHGNSYPKDVASGSLELTQSYLPYSSTSTSFLSRGRSVTQATAGQVVMRNMEGATVYSPCYTNGIGTIYFDAVNGWTGVNDYNNIVVEIATNTVEGLPPTDANCMTETTNYVDTTEVVTTNWYGKLDDSCWHPWTMRPFVITNGTAFVETNATKELSLQMDIGGRMDCFYRVVVPVDYHEAIRFRIRRTTYDKNWQVDGHSLILLDNIIASLPAMGAELSTPGHYDPTRTGNQQLGWELATSVAYPSINDEVTGYALPSYYVNEGEGKAVDTNEFVSSALMHYRWRYLNQTSSPWSTVDLSPKNGFKALDKIAIPDFTCDIEYWYETHLQAPFYSYVDYSGVGKAIDYTEERHVVTNALNSTALLASSGTNWFFRVRDGRSDYRNFDIVYTRDSNTYERVHMMLVGDHIWRGFIQTPTNLVGDIFYRIEGLDIAEEPFAEYAPSTNYWYCASDSEKLPVSDKIDPGSEETLSKLTLDAVSGYVMFQIADDTHGLTIVHADYQNFNVWSDARGTMFVGNSTEDAAKSGTSPVKQTFAQDFDTWKAMPTTDPRWKFTDFADIQSMLGRTAYESFAADTDGLWSVGPGMWVSKKYKLDTANSGVGLQMEGCGKGYLLLNDKDFSPRGIEDITLNARLGQFILFDDFNYYYGAPLMSMTNYTFMTRSTFDLRSNSGFSGNASLSIVADYLPNKGCYEARWEWIKEMSSSKGGQRLCLYRWNVNPNGTTKETLLAAWTNTSTFAQVKTTTLSTTEKFMPFYITVSNDTANTCTWVAAGVRDTGMNLSESMATSKSGWYIVAFRDNSTSRHVRGTYGVLSANCEGLFGNPQYQESSVFNEELGLAPGKGGYYSAKTRMFSGLESRTAGFDTGDTEWNIRPGRMKTEYVSTYVAGIVAAPAAQSLEVYLGTAGKTDWVTTPVTNISLTSFGGKPFTLPIYSNDKSAVKFASGGAHGDVRTDIVLDTVVLRQFRGDDYANGADMVNYIPEWDDPYSVATGSGFTNWVFTSGWITNNITKVGTAATTNGLVLISARRTRASDVSSVRSPLMDGVPYSDGTKRGIGLGMISFDYMDAQQNARLLVQIATNGVKSTTLENWDKNDAELWETVETIDFSSYTSAARERGTISVYIGMHGVTGLVRIVADPALVASLADTMDPTKFGEVKIGKVVCRDEPDLDSTAWWGWNLRTIGATGGVDTENRMYLPDLATDSEDVGMSLALNNSISADVDAADVDTYRQHVPFVQTPTFAAEVVGEVSFRARKYDTVSAQPASVTLYGSKSGSEDSVWTVITNFVIRGDLYRTYSYKTDPGTSYSAFRLGVSGVEGVTGAGSVVPSTYLSPVRVMIDEVFVSEAVRARMAFRNVGAFRSKITDGEFVPNVPSAAEQPICNEGWGVQCEVFASQLASEIDTSRDPEVILHWFTGTEPWGFESWKGKTRAEGHYSAPLAPATDTNGVFRSSYLTAPDAVIPMALTPGTVVQYMLEVRYYQTETSVMSTNYLASSDWEVPAWYRPVDYNADLGGGTVEGFSAYSILDTVAPGWAWINEVNIHGSYDSSWKNSEADCQFVEIAVPMESDISGWKIRFLGENKNVEGAIVTNTIASFGTSELPGMKPGGKGAASNMVFRVIGSPKAQTSGKLKAADGTLDGVWNFGNVTETFTSNGEVFSTDAFGIQLVRPTGIVEHELVCIGTNFYGNMGGGMEKLYSPTNTVEYFKKHMRQSSMFYAGADEADRNAKGEFLSLGVFESAGETSNQWNNVMKRTPGRINEMQSINPDHPTPNGDTILVFCNLDPDVGHIYQTVGDAVATNAAQTIFLRRGSEIGTNIVYTVDQWYELASVTTNGQFASFSPLAEPRKYVVTVGVGASNNVSVVAAAKVEDRLQRDFGLTGDNPYTPAVIDWLEKGTDLYGNKWPNKDSNDILLADFIRSDDSVITNLNLTQMYWLDMDPTIGNLALKGYISKGPSIHSTTGDGGQPMNNIRIDAFMQITNRATTAAWAPYALRGIVPGSSSLEYTNATFKASWTSATFKVVGFLDNGHTSYRNRENWVPLRWFVFTPDSFRPKGSADAFTSTIEVKDPFSTESPASLAGWYDWAQKYGKPQEYYFWCLDERMQPIDMEVLKQENIYDD